MRRKKPVQISKIIFPKNQNSPHSRDSRSKSLTHNQQDSRPLIRNKPDRMTLRLSALLITLFGDLPFTVEKGSVKVSPLNPIKAWKIKPPQSQSLFGIFGVE